MINNPVVTFFPYDIVAERTFLRAAHGETFELTFGIPLTDELFEKELARNYAYRGGVSGWLSHWHMRSRLPQF